MNNKDYIKIAQMDIMEKYPLIAYYEPEFKDLPNGTIFGTWALSVPGKVRFMLAKNVELAQGVLPGDVTRAWLRDEYTLPVKRRKQQIEASHYPAPLLAERGVWRQCAYVDIRSAYATILHLGYDLEYMRGRYIAGEPRPLPMQIKNNKFCYAIAVAMANTKVSSIQIKGNDGIFSNKTFNVFSNPCLFNLALDTLSAIYSEVCEVMGAHVHYVNTDGCIVDIGFEGHVLDIIRSWGFSARIKHQGQTEIRGVGSYICGTFSTKRFEKHAMDYRSPMCTSDERKWLKKRWNKWITYFERMLNDEQQ
jgi:hypothetical protein